MLGFEKNLRLSPLQGDLSVRLEPDVFQHLSDRSLSLPDADFEFDDSVRLDSDYERQFVCWVMENLGQDAARWLTPQASFDALTAVLGDSEPSGRRVDFLVHAPFGDRFVVEIDGPQHEDSQSPDRERDRRLGEVGIEVVRIPTAEIEQRAGVNLERVKELWGELRSVMDKRTLKAALTPVSLHRLAIALLDAVDGGFLCGKRWVVEVEDEPKIEPSLLWPYMRLFKAMDQLWGPSAMPEEMLLKTAGRWTRFDVRNNEPPEPCDAPNSEPDLIVRLQPHLTGMDKLDAPSGGVPEIVVRSACLPVKVVDGLFDLDPRANLPTIDPQKMEPALTEVLQAVFAKESFREGQLTALVEILEGRDCVVLLPTGAGKSLIYQMAGLCKPGRTIVVDPLIALIEDQQRGLIENGIDRVVGFSRFLVQQGQMDALLKQVVSGDALFVFVAPERFQQREFRNSIRAVVQATSINLAVIDEAHCVSEWGHDFRTAYLTLGQVLRDVCKDPFGSSPPLLALTGTASRAVLKDVLAQLEISTQSARSIVRPSSFDRPELEMATRQANPDEDQAVLAGSLQTMPSYFGVPAGEFFRSRGDRTYSGLIFCPHTSGQYGPIELQRTSARVVGFPPAIYSGGPPRQYGKPIYSIQEWEKKKREFAESFKNNSVPLMVSTNAFGMGIDKPNIRYVFHYGMPRSIEAYYQEIGRAGRDQEGAYCCVIWHERDRDRSNFLLTGNLEDVRCVHGPIRRVDSDSITQQTFFLLDSFRGVEREVAEVEHLLNDREVKPNLGRIKTVELAKGREKEQEQRERAIYRLMILGVVEDYLVESGKLVVNLAKASPASIADSLSRFLQKTTPGAQPASVVEFVARFDRMGLREAISLASRILIELIYDVIVESRRRSLREMYAALRAAAIHRGDVLRERVLDYLTEGDVSPILERLVDQTNFYYQDWEQELVKLQGMDDARELRGTSARLLGDYPIHPGMLFARAYAEVIHPAGDLQDYAANLEASLRSALERYGVSQVLLNEFASRHLASLQSNSPKAFYRALGVMARFHLQAADDAAHRHLMTVESNPSDGLVYVLDLFDRLGLARETVADIEARALSNPGGHTGVKILALSRKMSMISKDLESALREFDNGR